MDATYPRDQALRQMLTPTQWRRWRVAVVQPRGYYCSARNAIPGYAKLPEAVKKAMAESRRRLKNRGYTAQRRAEPPEMCGANESHAPTKYKRFQFDVDCPDGEHMLGCVHDLISMHMPAQTLFIK